MKNSLCFLVCCGAFLFVSGLQAGTEELENKTAVSTSQKAVEETPLDIFKLEQGYVFQSDLNHGGSFGQQDEIQSELEYGHRFLINGNFYAHVGFAYDRYDFGSTGAPVPNHLQAMAGIFGIDYMHGKDVGAFFQVRPGFYFQNDIGISSFDAPITLGRIFVVQENKFYIFVGAYASFLRSGFPVLPLAGVVYIPSDKLRIMAVLPEPKIIYSASKRLDLWAGGELVGGSFRTDRNDNIRPGKLNGAQVDFSDYRAGLGLTYGVSDNVSFDLGAGISFQRQFDFGRAGETYRTDPSPYVRMQMSASF
ncbi:MAG: hypothetical protein ABIU29_07260 [Chthoniobacterales bacterium]